jgi:hypothetical protein
MVRTHWIATAFVLAATAAGAVETAPQPPKGDKELSGMSIVGNDDAPKALVIVPWKSSAMGSALDVSRSADDGRQPVDRDVFRRELDYYRIRGESSGAGEPGAH